MDNDKQGYTNTPLKIHGSPLFKSHPGQVAPSDKISINQHNYFKNKYCYISEQIHSYETLQAL